MAMPWLGMACYIIRYGYIDFDLSMILLEIGYIVRVGVGFIVIHCHSRAACFLQPTPRAS